MTHRGRAVSVLVSCLTAVFLTAPRAEQAPQAVPQRPAQTQPARDKPRAADGTAVIRGRVVAADTGAPLRRARVNWSSDAPSPTVSGQQPPRVMTDADGRFEIRDLPAGRYRVFARRSGYLLMNYGARRGSSDLRTQPTGSERGVTIELADRQVFDGADFQLPRAGAITGRLLDEFGDPVISAFVAASRPNSVGGRPRLAPFASDTTDDLGEFRLSGLPPGAYLVVASAPGYLRLGGTSSFADMFYPGVVTRDQARAVMIREGQETADISFTLSPVRLARISGTVITSQGTVPRSGTFTLIRGTDTGMTQTIVFGTGIAADGTFSLTPVPPGDCDLTVSVQGEKGESEVGAVHLTVTGDDVGGVSIVTGVEGRLTGTVRTDTGAPLPTAATTVAMTAQAAYPMALPIRVVANAPDTGSDGVVGSLMGPGGGGGGAVNRDGSFAAPVRPGPRVIGIAGLPSGWALVSVMSGDRNLTDVPVDVAPGTTFGAQLVISNRLPEIAGRAVDENGQSTSDYTVVVFPRDPSKSSVSSLMRTERPNQRGDFRLLGLRPGDYLVAAVAADQDLDWTDPSVLDRLRTGAVEATVGLGEKKVVQVRVARIGT